MVYLPTFTIDVPLKTTVHVGKYSSPMDPMGFPPSDVSIPNHLRPSQVEKTKYIPAADFDNLINGMHVPSVERMRTVDSGDFCYGLWLPEKPKLIIRRLPRKIRGNSGHGTYSFPFGMVNFFWAMVMLEGGYRLRAPWAVHFPKQTASEKPLKVTRSPKKRIRASEPGFFQVFGQKDLGFKDVLMYVLLWEFSTSKLELVTDAPLILS